MALFDELRKVKRNLLGQAPIKEPRYFDTTKTSFNDQEKFEKRKQKFLMNESFRQFKKSYRDKQKLREDNKKRFLKSYNSPFPFTSAFGSITQQRQQAKATAVSSSRVGPIIQKVIIQNGKKYIVSKPQMPPQKESIKTLIDQRTREQRIADSIMKTSDEHFSRGINLANDMDGQGSKVYGDMEHPGGRDWARNPRRPWRL